MPTLPVAVAKSLGDDEVEALTDRLFVAPPEEPLGRGVPEHDLPVGVGDQHRVGEAAHHFRERRVIHGRPPNLRAGQSLSGRRGGARGATRPLRGGTGSSLEALPTRARARLRASRRIAPLRRRTPARLSHAWPPGRSRRSRRRCSCPQARLPAARVPSRPTANGPNGLPIVMSSASEYSARNGSTSPLMMAASARWLASTASLSSVSFTAPPPVSRFSWQQVAPQQPRAKTTGRAVRKEWDSNPRRPEDLNGFRGRPIRPLWHPSGSHASRAANARLPPMEVPEVQYARTNDGVRIAWQQWGSGPDVLVVPPIISNCELIWEQELFRRSLEYLGDHTRVTTPSTREGSGCPIASTRRRRSRSDATTS